MVPFAAHKGVSGLGPLYTPWQEVLETSDIITLHSPLTTQTRNMIAMPEFRVMQRRPIIVNTARGGLVDDDLVRALDGADRRRRLRRDDRRTASCRQPVDADREAPDVILTPHVGLGV